MVSSLAYNLPTESFEDEMAKAPKKEPASLYPSDFDLEKFNACVPERRAVLNHPNKDISVAITYHHYSCVGNSLDSSLIECT